MVRNSIDVATRVSPRLLTLIDSRINDPNARQPVTLTSVRIFLASLLSREFKEAEAMHHFDIGESLLDELDTLIGEFGADALAADFTQQTANEPLSRVIEAVMNDDSRDNPPTLATIREAIVGGLPASMVGEGAMEDDESESLLGEIDAMIERFGEDALAERFIRYD